MDHNLLNIAAQQGRGPAGVGSAQKQGITRIKTYYWLRADQGEKLVAQVFFRVDEEVLDSDDRTKLEKIADNLATMVDQGHKVTIQCIGRADVTYKRTYNKDLSERRAKQVADCIKKRMGMSAAAKLGHWSTGEKYSRTKRSFWLEDRRVDVIARVEAQFTYKFQHWCDNKDLLRPHIFKTYYPRYWLWRNRGLDYLIEQYENEDRPGGSGWVKIPPRDYAKVLEVVEMLADFGDWQNIKDWIKTRNREREVTTAYEVEYRKAYQIAYDRAELDFLKSDFRSTCEFFAIKFGLIPKNTPYAKRPGSTTGNKLEEEYKYKGSTKHGKP